MQRSCLGWESPCQHLAAVCYVLAKEFDRDLRMNSGQSWIRRGRPAHL